MTRFAPIERSLSGLSSTFTNMSAAESAHRERMLGMELAGRRVGMEEDKFALEQRGLLPKVQQAERAESRRSIREEEGGQLSSLNSPGNYEEFLGPDPTGRMGKKLGDIIGGRTNILSSEEPEIMSRFLAKSDPVDLVALNQNLRMFESLLIQKGAGTGENLQLDQQLESIRERLKNTQNGLTMAKKSPGDYAQWKLSRLSDRYDQKTALGMLNENERKSIVQIQEQAALDIREQEAEINKLNREATKGGGTAGEFGMTDAQRRSHNKARFKELKEFDEAWIYDNPRPEDKTKLQAWELQKRIAGNIKRNEYDTAIMGEEAARMAIRRRPVKVWQTAPGQPIRFYNELGEEITDKGRRISKRAKQRKDIGTPDKTLTPLEQKTKQEVKTSKAEAAKLKGGKTATKKPMAKSVDELNKMISSPKMVGPYKGSHAWEGRAQTIGERISGFTGQTQTGLRADLFRKGEDEITRALRQKSIGKQDLYDRNNLKMKLKTVYPDMTDSEIVKAILNETLLGE